jgi:hypothetical protein
MVGIVETLAAPGCVHQDGSLASPDSLGGFVSPHLWVTFALVAVKDNARRVNWR